MTLPDHMKFRVESPAHSEAIQKALFALGCEWMYLLGKKICRTDADYLVVAYKRIDASKLADTFLSQFEEFSLVKGQIVEGEHWLWDGFIPWFGGECPVGASDLCWAQLRDGSLSKLRGEEFSWKHEGKGHDIIAYRIVEEAQKQKSTDSLSDHQITHSHDYSITRDKGCFHAGAAWAREQLKNCVIIPKRDNRNPHADMIHEWAETGRAVQVLDEFTNTWGNDAHPKWIASWKYRWADEQPKPDVKVAAWLTSDSVKLYKDNREYGSRNAIFTFDADGNLKSVEKIK